MSGAFFRDLDIPDPDESLEVAPDAPALQVAEIMRRLVEVLSAKRPDLVLVVGDVNSTLAAALVAAKMEIPLAHVEAGLRSFDRTMPEEINRVLVDAVADHCFTTEPSANAHLRREGVAPARIHHVGNVMIDTLLRFQGRAAASPILERLGLSTGSFATLTLHRPGNVDDPGTLGRLLGALSGIAADVPIVFPVHPRTRLSLERARRHAPAGSRLILIEPLPYLDFVKLMTSSVCVLTDSGGIQEETTALGIPCLTLRDSTERPITVLEGTNQIVGLDTTRIADAWRQIRGGTWPRGRRPDLWDGKAAERIVRVLLALPGN
jgi:UDP-N-acetylglucosamine 2-epimerase (non-hydrolysing)